MTTVSSIPVSDFSYAALSIMLMVMTLSQRNYYFKGGIFVSSLCLIMIFLLAWKILPLYPQLVKQASGRSPGLFVSFLGAFFSPQAAAAPFSMTASVLYALSVSVFAYFFFEKTHAREILFFVLFSLSFLFEIFRIALPLKTLYGFPAILLTVASRLLLFGRFFGVLSLFASSVYAAGFEFQKQGSIVFGLVTAVTIIAMGVPVDTLSWDTSMTMVSGYALVFRLAETGIMAISVLSFFVASYTRGSREYFFIALGSVFVCIGRSFLLGADTLITPLPGIVLLVAGTVLIMGKLHQVYLWL